jgi:glycosyltransferase involved in cell wall biosynthesis
MKRITILTGNHLCHNPRVIKEATALTEAGYSIEVLGGWSDAELKRRDMKLAAQLRINFEPVLDLTQGSRSKRLFYRVRNKLTGLAHAKLGWENTWQLGYSVLALRRVALRRKADLFVAHSESALWSISQLPTSVARVGVDMEDWFSEDLMPEARKHRPVRLLQRLEQTLLCRAAHSSCPSKALSEALAKQFGCRPPTVIYNAFPWADRQNLDGLFKDRKNRNIPSIHWYSQTLGIGRGLEDLFAALPHLKNEVEIHLRGKQIAGFAGWLAAHVPESWRKRIILHPLVSNEELLSRVAEYDIGLAGEQKYCRSRDLTVTNKILHYLLGGLAVVASDTAGQREIAAQSPEAVQLYPAGNAALLAEQLNHLFASPQRLHEAKAAALRSAEQTFCWERQVPQLLRSVEAALAMS